MFPSDNEEPMLGGFLGLQHHQDSNLKWQKLKAMHSKQINFGGFWFVSKIKSKRIPMNDQQQQSHKRYVYHLILSDEYPKIQSQYSLSTAIPIKCRIWNCTEKVPPLDKYLMIQASKARMQSFNNQIQIHAQFEDCTFLESHIQYNQKLFCIPSISSKNEKKSKLNEKQNEMERNDEIQNECSIIPSSANYMKTISNETNSDLMAEDMNESNNKNMDSMNTEGFSQEMENDLNGNSDANGEENEQNENSMESLKRMSISDDELLSISQTTKEMIEKEQTISEKSDSKTEESNDELIIDIDENSSGNESECNSSDNYLSDISDAIHGKCHAINEKLRKELNLSSKEKIVIAEYLGNISYVHKIQKSMKMNSIEKKSNKRKLNEIENDEQINEEIKDKPLTKRLKLNQKIATKSMAEKIEDNHQKTQQIKENLDNPDCIFVVDIETTSFPHLEKSQSSYSTNISSVNGDIILEIAIVKIQRSPKKKRWTIHPLLHAFIDPQSYERYPENWMDSWIFRNGFLNSDQLRSYSMPFESIWPTVEKILNGNHVTSYNTDFDIDRFLLQSPYNIECKRYECIMELCSNAMNIKFASLKESAHHFLGFDYKWIEHSAVTDAVTAAKVLARLLNF